MGPTKKWSKAAKFLLFHGVIWGMSLVGILLTGPPSDFWTPYNKAELLKAILCYFLLVPVGVVSFGLGGVVEDRENAARYSGGVIVNPGVLPLMLGLGGFFLIILPPIRYLYLFALSNFLTWDDIMGWIIIVVWGVPLLLIVLVLLFGLFPIKRKKG
jgi:hypothetical protein